MDQNTAQHPASRVTRPGLAPAIGLVPAYRLLRKAHGARRPRRRLLATAAIVSGFAAVAGRIRSAGSTSMDLRSFMSRAAPMAVSDDWYLLARFGSLSLAHRLLYRRLDDRHVLHGHAGGLVHPRLLNGLHARRAARGHRSTGEIGKRRSRWFAAADSTAFSSTFRCSASACWAW